MRISYEYSNKGSAFLAHSLHPKILSSSVLKLSAPGKGLVYTNSAIVETFRNYYPSLYNISQTNSEIDYSFIEMEKKQIHIWNIQPLPSLDSATSSSLEVPFTSEELLTVIRTAKIGKVPGPNGLSSQFYKTFASDLSPVLLHSFNSISESQTKQIQVVIILSHCWIKI